MNTFCSTESRSKQNYLTARSLKLSPMWPAEKKTGPRISARFCEGRFKVHEIIRGVSLVLVSIIPLLFFLPLMKGFSKARTFFFIGPRQLAVRCHDLQTQLYWTFNWTTGSSSNLGQWRVISRYAAWVFRNCGLFWFPAYAGGEMVHQFYALSNKNKFYCIWGRRQFGGSNWGLITSEMSK